MRLHSPLNQTKSRFIISYSLHDKKNNPQILVSNSQPQSDSIPHLTAKMKRSSDSDYDQSLSPTDTKKPKLKPDPTTEFQSLDENLLYEILKHANAKTLATAACVSKTWCKTASDERLWEMICNQQWSIGTRGNNHKQLRSVVLALGGFRRLHSLYIWPLSKPSATTTTTATTSVETGTTSSSVGKWRLKNQNQNQQGKGRLGKEELHLSLSLLSIRYYEKMNLGFGMMKR